MADIVQRRDSQHRRPLSPKATSNNGVINGGDARTSRKSIDYFSLGDFFQHGVATKQQKQDTTTTSSKSNIDHSHSSTVHPHCQHQHHHSENCNSYPVPSAWSIAATAHARAISLSRPATMGRSVGGEEEGRKNGLHVATDRDSKRTSSRRIPFLRTLSMPGVHGTNKAISNMLGSKSRSRNSGRPEDELREGMPTDCSTTSGAGVEHLPPVPSVNSSNNDGGARVSGSASAASGYDGTCASATTTAAPSTSTRIDRRFNPSSGERASPPQTQTSDVHDFPNHHSTSPLDNRHSNLPSFRPAQCSGLRFTLSADNNDSAGVAMQRKIWVKRPGASATRVTVNEDDLVDNVRDVILDKYANSLGKTIDSPDISLKIISREPNNKNVPAERVLGPEEAIGQTFETLYPGGQTIDEALVIEIAQRRTPRPSPRVGNHQPSYSYYTVDHARPDDGARDYFPPMPLHSPHLAHAQAHPQAHPQPHPQAHPQGHPHASMQHFPTSMAVLTTGQLPPLPSPGAHSTRQRHGRPKYTRQHTSSPTILHSQQSTTGIVDPKAQLNGVATAAPTMPTPPAQMGDAHKSTITPPNRTASPHGGTRAKRKKNINGPRSVNGDVAPPLKSVPSSVLNVTVPPINVLIVEDNVINLKLLEKFMVRLRVRWKSAMNGREAVDTWRQGGFHLILMDIQLPIMNGLEATKEIRRLEAVNNIGVFSGSPIDAVPRDRRAPAKNGDTLPDRALFKSPVIIVALTASSLQSDRHAALAAGCNDFLTKPVIFSWMERKVTEWGCMQALIDFDGWKKWKELADEKERVDNEMDPAKKAVVEKEEKARTKAALKAMFAKGPPSTSTQATGPKKDEKPKEAKEKEGPMSPMLGSAPLNGTAKKAMGRQKSARPGSLGGGGSGLAPMPEEEMDQKP